MSGQSGVGGRGKTIATRRQPGKRCCTIWPGVAEVVGGGQVELGSSGPGTLAWL